uniref:Uncharacterized protein n=1 Tax=Phasianus colchicus TaxID=9054 RepID=A0A669QVN9_PHACC
MCLVFCAFASWAVKTSDLQAPDAWKTGVFGYFLLLAGIRMSADSPQNDMVGWGPRVTKTPSTVLASS